MLGKQGITAPIVGATKPHHLQDAIAAVSLRLSPEEISVLEESYVPHPVLGTVNWGALNFSIPGSEVRCGAMLALPFKEFPMHPTRIALALLLAEASPRPSPGRPQARCRQGPLGRSGPGAPAHQPRTRVRARRRGHARGCLRLRPHQRRVQGREDLRPASAHVASANFMFAAGIAGEKPGGSWRREWPRDPEDKADIIKFLKDSFAYAHKAFAGITDANATASIPTPWGKVRPRACTSPR